jgi:hypothetical protein
MHSAIFAVDMPPESDRQKWIRYLAVVGPKIERAAVERIAENVWQVDFQKSPAALAHLIAAADHRICHIGSWRWPPNRNGLRSPRWPRRVTSRLTK